MTPCSVFDVILKLIELQCFYSIFKRAVGGYKLTSSLQAMTQKSQMIKRKPRVLPGPRFSPEWDTFNTVAAGRIDPNNNVIFSPWNGNFSWSIPVGKRVFYRLECDFYRETPLLG